MSKTPKVYALFFNEDGDPPMLEIFDSEAELKAYIMQDCANDRLLDPETFNPQCDSGILAFFGTPVLRKK